MQRGRCAAAVLAVAGANVFAGGATAQAQLPLEPSCNPATIAGTALDGERLTASRGSCSGTPTPTVTLQWFLCNPQLQNCVARTDQAQASSLAYTVKPADVNGRLVVQQIGTNLVGSDRDDTATDVVAAIPPSASPVVSGVAQVGQQLSGSEGFLSGTSPSVVARGWLRCDANGSACLPISEAGGEQYLITAADLNTRIRFQVTVQGPQQSVNVQSAPTAVVSSAPEQGQEVGGDPGTGQGGGGQGGSGSPAPRKPAAPQLMRPFPNVAIAGRVYRVGAVISSLVVRGPNGAHVVITCRGRGCPVRRQRRTIRARSLHLRRFETGLFAGTTIEIRVTMRGRVGKFTRLRIRSDRPPARSDLCLTPGKRRPVGCPEGAG